MSWVALALISAAFTSLRYLHIRKRCSATPPTVLVFATRAIGSVILLPSLAASPLRIADLPTFVTITAITVVVTMGATIANVRLLQKSVISRTVPYLSMEPLFMIPWALLILHELPRPLAAAGILLACAGAYILNLGASPSPLQPLKAILGQRDAMIMLLVAFALSCTTVCDKLAIRASSATTYAFIWTLTSAVVTGLLILSPTSLRATFDALHSPHTYLQTAFWAGSFLSQMAGVQMALRVPSGVTYVKTLTMVNVVFTVAAGGFMLKEKHLARSLIASSVMVAGAVLIVLMR